MAGLDLYDVRNLAISLFIVAFFVTSYRCISRYTKRLWWHDDSVALFSMLCYVFFVIGITILSDVSSSRGRSITGYYIGTFGYHAPNWGARVSIILTLVRITPWPLQKKILLWVAALFVLLFVILTVQMYWVCELTYPGWKEVPGAACVLPEAVAITQVVATVTSDAILIAAPLMVIRGVHNRALRFRLFPIFSMSIVATLASVGHAVMVMVSPGVWEGIFGILEAAVSVIVCNMSVIIPAILRVLGVGDPFMQEDTVTPNVNTEIEIIRMTSGIELSLPTLGNTGITDSIKSEEAIGTVGSRPQVSVDLGAGDNQKHLLATQASDGSLGNMEPMKVVPLVDESDITDSLTQAGSLPAVKKDQDIEMGIGGRHSKSDNT